MLDSLLTIVSLLIVISLIIGNFSKIKYILSNLLTKHEDINYAVFSFEEIEWEKKIQMDSNKEWSRLVDQLPKLMKKENKVIDYSSYSKEVKNMFKEIARIRVEIERRKERIEAMLQSNIDVLNGKKTILKAREDYEKKYLGMLIVSDSDEEVMKRYSEWLERKQ